MSSHYSSSSSLNGSTSNPPDEPSGRTITHPSFTTQFGSMSPVFYPDGSLQGVCDIHGNLYFTKSDATRGPRTSGPSVVPSVALQQQNERYAPTNMPVGTSQMSYGGSSRGNSGLTSRGVLGGSPTLVSAGSRPPSSMGNMTAGDSRSRTVSSDQQIRIMSRVQQQGSPQVYSMRGSSHPTAAVEHSQNQVQAMNSQLEARMKQGIGLSPMYQPNQEFNTQNEDFPALPGHKGDNDDYLMDLHHKELMRQQSQQSSMARHGGITFGTVSPSLFTEQNQNAQAVSSSGLSSNGSNIFSSVHPSYNSQTGGGPSSAEVRSMGHNQPFQQYQHQYTRPKISPIGHPFRVVGSTSRQAAPSRPDPFRMLGLLDVIRQTNPHVSTLALGMDLTKLGLDLESRDNIFKTFASPWANEPLKFDHEFVTPECFNEKMHQPPDQELFRRLLLDVLFYIFYSMPKDEAQLLAANELNNRGWFYHKEHKRWMLRIGEPLVQTNAYEGGTYDCFDPDKFEIVQIANTVIYYEMLEKRPSLPQHRV